MKVRIGYLMIAAVGITALLAPVTAGAELHSCSKDIIVMEAHDLPELAQLPGDALFLHSDNQGSTYLYIEQQEGRRLSVLDVTDPAHIRVASTTRLQRSGAFDFAGALNGRNELLRYRDGRHAAILDLHKAKHPRIKEADGFGDTDTAQTLGTDGILAIKASYRETRVAAPADFEVLDVSVASAPVILATIKDVEQRAVNQETGTTFLLGKNGLTVVRQISAEYEHQVHEMQMQGN